MPSVRVVLRVAELVERWVFGFLALLLRSTASVAARLLGRGRYRRWRRQAEDAARRRARRARR